MIIFGEIRILGSSFGSGVVRGRLGAGFWMIAGLMEIRICTSAFFVGFFIREFEYYYWVDGIL